MIRKETARSIFAAMITLSFLFFPVVSSFAQNEGILLQKDILLDYPIHGPEDLPEAITFTLYDSQNAVTPLGAQTFLRGNYTVDFEFSQSDGVTAGSVARVKAYFTNRLNLKDSFGENVMPKALWMALEVAAVEVGVRTKVSEEAMVRLLLASNASIATYLTLFYEGDQSPFTTIYKDLPLSTLGSDGSTPWLTNYFSPLIYTGNKDFQLAGSDGQIQYNNGGAEGGAAEFYYDDVNGRVGVGVPGPFAKLHVADGTDDPSRGFVTSLHLGSAAGSLFNFYKSRGTLASPQASREGDNVGIFVFKTYDGKSYKRTASVGSRIDNGPIGQNIWFATSQVEDNNPWANGNIRMVIESGGNIGIGTTNPTANLSVNGTILAKELMVTEAAEYWPDYVFSDSYRLPPLNELEEFISKNRHLPGIPSESDVKEKGVSLGEMSSNLLRKVEELTLYVIDMKKENDALKAQLRDMQAQIRGIKK